MNETDFTNTMIETCHTFGYLVCHFRPAKTEKGWRTPLQGDRGIADLIIAGHGRTIFAELKSERGQLEPEQERWRDVLADGPCEYYLWRPSDFDDAVAILARR